MAFSHLIDEGRRERPSPSTSPVLRRGPPTASNGSPQVYTRGAMLGLWRKDATPGKPMSITQDAFAPPASELSPAPTAPTTRRDGPSSTLSPRDRDRSNGTSTVIDRGALPRSRMGSTPGQGVMGVLSGLAPGAGGTGPHSPTALSNGIGGPSASKQRSGYGAKVETHFGNLHTSSSANDSSSRSTQRNESTSTNGPTPWAGREDHRRSGPLRSDVPVWRRGGGPLSDARPLTSSSRRSLEQTPSPVTSPPPTTSISASFTKPLPVDWDEDAADESANRSTATSALAEFSAMPEGPLPPAVDHDSPLHEYEELPQQPSVHVPQPSTSLLSDLEDPLLRRSINGGGNDQLPPGLEPPPSLPPIDGPIWSYRDPSGQTQGPFTSTQMQDWHRAGFFVPDLLVMCARDPRGTNLYEPLGSLIERVRDADRPFFTAASMQAPHPLPPPPPLPLPSYNHPVYLPQPTRGFTSNYDPYIAPAPPIPTMPQPTPLDPWGGRLQTSRIPSTSSAVLLPWEHLGSAPSPSLGDAHRVSTPVPSLLRSLTDDGDRDSGQSSAPSRRPSWPPQPQSSVPEPSPWSNSTLPPIGRVSEVEDEATMPMLPIGTPPVYLSPSPSQTDLRAVSVPPSVVAEPESIVEPNAVKATVTKSTPVKATPAPVAMPPVSPSLPTKLPPPTTTPVSPKMSLRDIQARETKLAEAQRAAERDKRAAMERVEREAAAAAAPSMDEAALSSSSTWGGSVPPPAVAPAPLKPAWSKPIKPVAASTSSLAAIQADEAARKQRQAAAAKLAAANVNSTPAMAKGAYASAASTSNVGWTTIAAGGAKVAAASTPPPPAAPGVAAPKPSMTVMRPTPKSVPGASVAAAASSRPSAAASSVKVSAASSDPPPPSAELRKWIKSSLTGLTANLDDFITMLASMPLNPDADMLEVIADSVYANSTQLDGRRWATEYVKRRKEDVARKNGTASLSNGRTSVPAMPKPTSMADAVRAIPQTKAVPDNFRLVVKSAQGKGGKRK